MDAEDEESWLASVIGQVDKLALRIGGYEEEPTDRGFSDDESDGSTSEDDEVPGASGFEDAVEDADYDSGFEGANEISDRPQSTDTVQDPEEERGLSKTLENTLLRHMPSTKEGKANSLPVTQPHSSQNRLNMEVAQTLEEILPGDAPHKSRQEMVPEQVSAVLIADNAPSASVTPRHSQDRFNEDDLPASERAPSQKQEAVGGGFNLMFSTPAHSRDRNTFILGPPVAVAPDARCAGSRRGHRDKNRSKEDLGTTLPEAMRTDTTRKSAPVNASLSPSTSRPLTNINRSAGSTVKKFSYMNDTDWLKPKEDLLEAAPPQPEVAAVAVPGEYAEIQITTAAAVDSGGVSLPWAAWKNQRRPSLETEQQRRQEILEDGYAKDIHIEGLPKGAVDKRARDAEIAEGGPAGSETGASDECARDTTTDEGGLAETEAVASADAGNDFDVADRLHEFLLEDQGDENGYGESHEGNGTIQVVGEDREGADNDGVGLSDNWADGVEHPDGLTDETAVTIGAKRASVETGKGAEELGWMIDSPVGFAPSKRGKTQLQYPLVVMRHSARLDDAIHERQRKREAWAPGCESDENSAGKGGSDGIKGLDDGVGDELDAVPWPDRALRPYDSPIIDTDLPARQAKELSRYGMDSQTLILCSPFRRCLQTAGVVARTLGVTGVTVDLEVGERMDKVRKEIAELALALEEDSDATLGEIQPAPVFTYLKEEDMREALGPGVQFERLVGEQPPEDESGVEAKHRFIATIARVREEQLRDGPVLVVAHGDTLDAAGESLASQIVFEADYCAWALFHLDTHTGYVAESYGTQMIPL